MALGKVEVVNLLSLTSRNVINQVSIFSFLKAHNEISALYGP